jgi:hypothetical protein
MESVRLDREAHERQPFRAPLVALGLAHLRVASVSAMRAIRHSKLAMNAL